MKRLPGFILFCGILPGALALPVQAVLSKASSQEDEAWRLDCGAAADFVDSTGALWMKDESFPALSRWGNENGAASSVTGPVAGAGPLLQPLRSARTGGTNLAYRIALPSGVYQVRLLFSDPSSTAAGQREFDVALEGVTVLDNHDIFAAVGANAKNEHSFWPTVSDGVLDITFPQVSAGQALISAIEVKPFNVSDDAFLDFIERKAFWYILDEAHPSTYLLKERENNWAPGSESPADLAATGLSLAAYTVAASRGWMTASAARDRIMSLLTRFDGGISHVRGFWYRSFDRATGARAGASEVSLMDSALFIAAALQAGEYFRVSYPEIAAQASVLYQRMEWDWWLNRGGAPNDGFLNMGWKPAEETGVYDVAGGGGFFNRGWWNDHSEGNLAVLLALASPTHPIPSTAWTARSLPWVEAFNLRFVHKTSLAAHTTPALFFDFRGRHDGVLNHQENGRLAVLANRETAVRDSLLRYAPRRWGLSPCYGPGDVVQIYGGDPGGTRDGTVCLPATISSLVFAPNEAVEAARYLYFQYKHHVWGKYGWSDGLNVSQDFRSTWTMGANAARTILAVENHRSGMVRDSFMASSPASAGLSVAGFSTYQAGSPLYTASSALQSPRNAFDGNMSTRWESLVADPQWLSVDFGTGRMINRVSIHWEGAYADQYTLQGSQDGVSWRDLQRVTAGNGGLDEISFTPTTTRFLRLLGTRRATEWAYSIFEMSAVYDPSTPAPGKNGISVGAVIP